MSPPYQPSIYNDGAPTDLHILQRRDSDPKKPIIIGAVVGFIIAIIGVGIVIVMVCYRKALLAKYGHLIGVHSASEDTALPTAVVNNSPQTTPKPVTFPTPVFSAFSSHSRPDNDTSRGPASGSVASHEREKSLPSLPPPSQNNPSTPTKRLTRAIASLGSKRPTLTLQVSKHRSPLKTIPSVNSATSSFFPHPFHDNTSKENVAKKKRSSSVISQIDGGNEQPLRKPLAPVAHTFPPSTAVIRGSLDGQGPNGEQKEPQTSYPHHPRQDSISSTTTSLDTPISSSPEILGRYPYSSRNSTKSIKVGIPLASIAENLSRSPASPGSPSTRSTKSLEKRRSEGRVRAEKEKQRRRHHKALPSPGGPRDRFSSISRTQSQNTRSSVTDSRSPLLARPRPRPLPQRPGSSVREPVSSSRPETPLPPYAIGNDILPLYFEKAKRASRKSVRQELLSVTPSRHFLPSPPPSASGSSTGHGTPTTQKTPSPRPLPVITQTISPPEPRRLPIPNRPRALTDTAASKPMLLSAPVHTRNRSVDIPTVTTNSDSQASHPAEAKPFGPTRQVVQKKSAESSTSTSSLGHPKHRPPPLHSKSDPATTVQMTPSIGNRKTPTSVPVTPKLNSWSDAGTYRYTIQEDSQETGGEGTNRRLATLQAPRGSRPPSGALPTPPISSKSTPPDRRITRKPPPVEVTPPVLDTVIDVEEEHSTSTPLPTPSPHTPTTRTVVIPPSPHTPPPPTPPTPRRRAKIWDEFGRRRIAPITPTIQATSPLAKASVAETQSISGSSSS